VKLASEPLVFRRRLAQTIAWCAPRASAADPARSLRTAALRPPDLNASSSYTTLQRHAAARLADDPSPHLRERYRILRQHATANGIPLERLIFGDLLVELSGYTQAAIQADIDKERQSAVADLAEQRATLLREQGAAIAESGDSLAGGRLLLYEPDLNLADGAAALESGGFFDVDNTPPWDTWVDVVPLAAPPPRLCLVSWVPPQMIAVAARGALVNPEGCIYWAETYE